MGFPTGTLFYNSAGTPMYRRTKKGFLELWSGGVEVATGRTVVRWDREEDWKGWRIEYPKEDLFDRLYLTLKS